MGSSSQHCHICCEIPCSCVQTIPTAEVAMCEQCGFEVCHCPPELADTKDPWKHRSQGMVCATCMWCVMKTRDPGAHPAGNKSGRCRRRAPTMNGYPAVFENDWCGDHKLDENKL